MVLILPGVPAPAGAPIIDVSRLTPSSQLLGAIRPLLNRLTATYTQAEIAALRRTYALLVSADVLSVLDSLSFKMKNEADSLLNWAKEDSSSVNYGASFGPHGFDLDGVDDWIDPNADVSGAGNYRLVSAHAGTYISRDKGTGTFPAIGTVGGSQTHLHPRFSGGTQIRYRINSGTTSIIDVGNRPFVGLWSMYVSNSEGRQYLFLGANSIASDNVSFTGLPSAIGIGRNLATFGSAVVSGWFAGATLGSARRTALAQAFEVMRRAFVAD